MLAAAIKETGEHLRIRREAKESASPISGHRLSMTRSNNEVDCGWVLSKP